MPVAKTISIPYLAQAMMAVILLKPDSARARPSTLINSDVEYKRIFSLDMPIDVYLKVIHIAKEVENYLKPSVCGYELERKVITNIKYYVTMILGITVAGGTKDTSNRIASLPSIIVTEKMLNSALNTVTKKFESLGASDQVAKGSELVAALLEDAEG